jgi:histidinol-phosphate aminotransferase
MPIPRPGILDLPSYPPAERLGPGAPRPIQLASNECAAEPSPLAIAAFWKAAANLRRYPDPGAGLIVEALAAHHRLDAARIVCGAGSEELIYLLARAYCDESDEVVLAEYGYMLFRIAAQLAGATPVLVRGPGLAPDLATMVKAITQRTRLIFLANPNNPTGHCPPAAQIEALWRPKHVLLVLDAANAEYVTHEDYASGLALASRAANVVVLRTFSKVYGLASLRIGAYAPGPITDVLRRSRPPTSVSGPAQAAAAAAVQDQAHVSRIATENARVRAYFAEELVRCGLEPISSEANIILARFPGNEAAAAVYARLKLRSIIARPMHAYGLGQLLRFTIDSCEEMDTAAKALSSP